MMNASENPTNWHFWMNIFYCHFEGWHVTQILWILSINRFFSKLYWVFGCFVLSFFRFLSVVNEGSVFCNYLPLVVIDWQATVTRDLPSASKNKTDCDSDIENIELIIVCKKIAFSWTSFILSIWILFKLDPIIKV